MAKTHGAKDYKLSLTDARAYAKRLRQMADLGDPQALHAVLQLDHEGVFDRLTNGDKRKAAQ